MRIAVILARGGSRRIPPKNIRDFCGKPMIACSIEAARRSGLFDHVLVSTDDHEIASRYREAFRPLSVAPDVTHPYHLFVVRLDRAQLSATGDEVFAALKAKEVGTDVHYIPIHLHWYCQRSSGRRRASVRARSGVRGDPLAADLPMHKRPGRSRGYSGRSGGLS